MIMWLWQSSLLLAVVSTLLLLAHPMLLKQLGPRSCYLLWLTLPVAVLLPLLPDLSLARVVNPPIIDTLLITSGQIEQSIQASANLPYLLWLWGTGAFAMSAWCLASFYQLKRQLQQQRHVASSQLSCYIDPANQGPAIFGFFRPHLLLPADFHHRFSRSQRRLILQHELCHWQRGDLHANLLAIILLCLFWFHPLVWLAYRRYRADQELACDADVLRHHARSTQFCYANALLAAMQSATTPPVQFQPFCHHYGATQSMKERLLQLKQQHGFSKTPALILITALIAGALLWQQPLFATHSATPSNAPTPNTAEPAKASPVVRIEPRYPLSAVQNRVEGSVQLQFNVTSNGKTSDIQIIHAQPEGVFEAEAIRAIERWRYQPSKEAAANLGLTVQLDFALDYDPEQDMERVKVKPGAE